MTRTQLEQYTQDRLGNLQRKLDDIRAEDGMSEGHGLVEVETEDVDEELLVMVPPEGVQDTHVVEIHAHNSSDDEGTFELHEAEVHYDEESEEYVIEDTEMRSVPFNVSDGQTRTIPYGGREYKDAVAVRSGFEGHIGVIAYSDAKEHYEPSSEMGDTEE